MKTYLNKKIKQKKNGQKEIWWRKKALFEAFNYILRSSVADGLCSV